MLYTLLLIDEDGDCTTVSVWSVKKPELGQTVTASAKDSNGVPYPFVGTISEVLEAI